MNQTPKKKRRRCALNMPTRVYERVADEGYGPGDHFPYVIKDIGKTLDDLFGKEVLRLLADRQRQLRETASEREPALCSQDSPAERH